MRITISKTLFTLIASFLMFLGVAESANAFWQCNSPRNTSAYDYFMSWHPQTRAEIIRERVAIPSNWGDRCVVPCTAPGCGSCECRCQGDDLYCADIWTIPAGQNYAGRVAAQTCTWNVKSSYDNRCVPTANIASPSGYYELGSNILFSANGSSDGNGETLSYHWRIRTVANHNAGNTSADITISTYSRNFNRSNLGVDDYIAFLTVRNKQGVYAANPTWKWSMFSVGRRGSCGTANGRAYPHTATGYAPYTQCSIGSSNNVSFPSPGNSASWSCLGINGGSSASCSANRLAPPAPIDGSCGTASGRTYAASDTGYSPYSQCAIGSSSNTNFPTPGGSQDWTCSGTNGGNPSATCSASRLVPCSYSCGAPIDDVPDSCEESDCSGGCPSGQVCAGNKEYIANKTFCYEVACGSNIVDNSFCGGSCNPDGDLQSATCSCQDDDQDISNWIEVPAN